MTDAEFRDAAQKAVLAAIASSPPPQDQMALIEDFLAGERGRGSWYGMDAPGGSPPSPDNGRFAVKSIEGTTVMFKNPYYDVDCKTYVSTSDTVTVSADSFTFVALQLVKTYGLPSATLVTYASFEAMSQAQKDASKAVIPLYKFDKGAVECDFRTGPQIHAWEFSG